MSKKIVSVFALVLFALFSNGFGQDKYLDVILRDFNSNYPGFEEFDTDKGASGQCAGSNPDTKNSFATDLNRICFSGSTYQSCDKGGTTLKYGHTDNCNNWATSNGYPKNPANNKCRWFCNGPDQKNFNCDSWSNEVYVTKGIVQNDLHYDKEHCDLIEGEEGDQDYIRYRYCARPQKGNGACYGDGVESWFTDGEHTRVYKDVVTLKPVGNYHEVNHDYNTYVNWGKGEDNGYFPLDRFENEPDIYGRAAFNAQSIRVWCPSGGNGDPDPDPRLCNEWRAAGGPRNNLSAARTVAQSNNVMNRLHNYSFSMAGSGEFKYYEKATSDDVFEFIGDDDMWIFIDGKLVADLGGNHLAAPAKINVSQYGRDNGWTDASKHAVNFFYLDRQTDGSNMKLRMALTGLSDPRFGAPKIIKAETTQKQNGTSSTIIWVNNKLDEESIKNFIGKGQFPIVINKQGDPNLLGYRLESISEPQRDGSGYAYTITGQVCNGQGCGGNLIINSGDSLSFNVMFDNLKNSGTVFDGLALPDDSWYIKATNKTPATTLAWGVNTTDLPPIDFNPDVPDKTPVKPPFVIADGGGSIGGDQGDNTVPPGAGGSVGRYDGGGKFPNVNTVWDAGKDGGKGGMVSIYNVDGVGRDNNDVHGFGTVGKQIPTQRAGELILTVFPSTTNAARYEEWLGNEEKQKLFGLPPKMEGDPNNPESTEWWGLADPSKEADNGGYQFVKNGFPNESSTKGNIKIAPTRCTMKIVEGEPRINCLNFSLLAKQPFNIAVTVYDQLGNFVTQYREKITEQEFRNVVQAPNYINNGALVNPSGASAGCEKPDASNYGAPTTLTTNGQIKVNVNIYPFSADGRRFGNGVYIAKIDRVDLPFKDGEKDPNTKNGYTCASAGGGNATKISPSFVRYHADQKFGWMRSTSK